MEVARLDVGTVLAARLADVGEFRVIGRADLVARVVEKGRVGGTIGEGGAAVAPVTATAAPRAIRVRLAIFARGAAGTSRIALKRKCREALVVGAGRQRRSEEVVFRGHHRQVLTTGRRRPAGAGTALRVVAAGNSRVGAVL